MCAHARVIKDDIFRKYTYINILYNGVAGIFGQKARLLVSFIRRWARSTLYTST